MIISTKVFINAVDFYQKMGFNIIDTPYLVEPSITKHTHKGLTFKHKGFDYVGSAEQGFLQMLSDGQLPKGRWMALTPCCREDTPDNTHFKVFMKLELISVAPENSEDELLTVRTLCENFFTEQLSERVNVLETEEGSDIESLSGVELGSYGIRTFQDITYVYATGVTEPRFSLVKSGEV